MSFFLFIKSFQEDYCECAVWVKNARNDCKGVTAYISAMERITNLVRKAELVLSTRGERYYVI